MRRSVMADSHSKTSEPGSAFSSAVRSTSIARPARRAVPEEDGNPASSSGLSFDER